METNSLEDKPHDLNDLLELIVGQCERFTNAERVIIYLYDEHERVLWNRAGKGADFMELEFKLGQGIPGQVMDKVKSIVINDVSDDGRFNPSIDDVTDVSVKSMLCAPIVDVKHKKIGAIQLINKLDGEFDEKDITFIEAMCAQASIAIENTILFGSLQNVRKREQELMEEIKEQNDKLQEAYLKIEEEKEVVEETSKSRGRLGIASLIGAVVIFLLLGVYFLKRSEDPASIEEEEISAPGSNFQTITVQSRPLNFPQTVFGNLDPVTVTNVFVPFTGRVVSRNFVIGEMIEEGQELLVIDSDRLESEYRNAQIEEINAREVYEAVKDWENSDDLARARKELAKAKEDLITSRKLYELGIISKDQLTAREDGLESREKTLEAVLKKGDEQNVRFARFKWINAKVAADFIKEKLDRSVIRADVTGIASEPPVSGQKKVDVENGLTIPEGTVFLSIADTSRFKVLGKVPETKVTAIRLGQAAEITGDAFPGITIDGKVTYISEQADRRSRIPLYDIHVETSDLSEEMLEKVKVGMSATLSVITYSNPDALMVPFSVIRKEPDGTAVYRIESGATEPQRVLVETGLTTLNEIEILSGIQEGDQLVLLQ